MFFGVAPRFCKKKNRCFQNRRNFAETTENVVPNWRGRKTPILHPRVRNRLSWSGQRNGPDISVAAFSLLSHTSSKRQGQLFDIFAFSLLDNKSLSIILVIELFLCNKYLSFWSWFWSNFLCFCWLCLFFCVGASASDSPSSFRFFLQFSFFFLPVVFLLFWVVCFLVIVSFPLLLFFSFSCVSFSSSPMLFLFFLPFFLFFSCISFDCSCCCGSCHYSSSFSACVFSSPSPPRAFEQENNGLKNQSFCLPFGDPCENVLSQNHCFFSLVDFFHRRTCFCFMFLDYLLRE